MLVSLVKHRISAQKQSSSVLKIFAKFTGKHLCQNLVLNNVAGVGPATLFKKGLWHRCFPMNSVKILRTPFFIEHIRWLLLSAVKITSELSLELFC